MDSKDPEPEHKYCTYTIAKIARTTLFFVKKSHSALDPDICIIQPILYHASTRGSGSKTSTNDTKNERFEKIVNVNSKRETH
jgi:hypothetical protein